ncbi:MAG: hypothetical protein AB8B83_02585 [Bdellovibrionales bacterium]
MSLVGDKFREHRGKFALSAAGFGLMFLLGCAKSGDYNHSVVPPVAQTPEQQQKA